MQNAQTRAFKYGLEHFPTPETANPIHYDAFRLTWYALKGLRTLNNRVLLHQDAAGRLINKD